MDALGWRRVADGYPTKEDADWQDCVLVWHMYSGVMVYNYQNMQRNQMITHWRHMIEPPEDIKKQKRGEMK